jgi:transcription initiation factor IIF auxiliary subunit
MALKISQDAKYQGEDWWDWAVWVDGPKSELANIKCVTYTLHPTFRDPVRRVTDAANKFKLETAGWGTFKIYADVEHKDGTRKKLTHTLDLQYPDGTSTDK